MGVVLITLQEVRDVKMVPIVLPVFLFRFLHSEFNKLLQIILLSLVLQYQIWTLLHLLLITIILSN